MTKDQIIIMIALAIARKLGSAEDWLQYRPQAENVYSVLKSAGLLVEEKP